MYLDDLVPYIFAEMVILDHDVFIRRGHSIGFDHRYATFSIIFPLLLQLIKGCIVPRRTGMESIGQGFPHGTRIAESQWDRSVQGQP